MNTHKNIFERLMDGETVPFNDPDYHKIGDECMKTQSLVIRLNSEPDAEKRREIINQILPEPLQEGTWFMGPFQVNYGKNLHLGKNIFLNSGFTCLDLGGVIIEDHVMIAPNVTISSEGHPTDPAKRNALTPAKVHIKQNVWIGANATILPGVTIGENSIVAAGAVVTKNVPENCIIGGVPAKVIKEI